MPDPTNWSFVGVQGNNIFIGLYPHPITKERALNLAAWLVVLAEEKPGEFEAMLAAVKET